MQPSNRCLCKVTPSKLIRAQSNSNLLYPYLTNIRSRENFQNAPQEPSRSSSTYFTAIGASNTSSATKLAAQSNSMRAFNFNLQHPILRNSSSEALRKPASQQQQSSVNGRALRCRQHHQHHNHYLHQLHHHHHHPQQLHHHQHRPTQHRQKATATVGTNTASLGKPSKSSLPEQLPQSHEHELNMQRSFPVFEVLPPLLTSATQSLLYQNSYLLDGVKFDCSTSGQQSPSGGNTKLKLDYKQFLKSISSKSKPSDRDVIFGNAKVLLSNTLGWERSRIDWLLQLERRQEVRRKRRQRQGSKVGTEKTLEVDRAAGWDDSDDDENAVAVHICCFPFTKEMLTWHIV